MGGRRIADVPRRKEDAATLNRRRRNGVWLETVPIKVVSALTVILEGVQEKYQVAACTRAGALTGMLDCGVVC